MSTELPVKTQFMASHGAVMRYVHVAASIACRGSEFREEETCTPWLVGFVSRAASKHHYQAVVLMCSAQHCWLLPGWQLLHVLGLTWR